MESFSRECAEVFSHGVLTGLEGNPPALSQNILFHSKSNGGLIEYSATNVVATRCLSHPHIFPKAYIDRREQDVKDGGGLKWMEKEEKVQQQMKLQIQVSK